MKRSFYRVTPLVAAMTLALSACGGGGGGSNDPGADSGASTIVTNGIIEGFGSVIVNGVKYEVEGDIVTVEADDNGTDVVTGQNGLQIGMRVTIEGEVNDDGVTGRAAAIRFDDDLQGPVSGLVEDAAAGTKTFTLAGRTVIASAADTVFDDTPAYSYAALTDGDLIEVSGLFDDQGNLVATFIEKKVGTFQAGVTLVEVKGTVSNLDTVAGTFNVGSLLVNYDAGDLDDSLGQLAEDLFVEVKGTLSADGTTMEASKIEREGLDDSIGDAKVSIEGLIADLDTTAQTFSINTQVISFAGSVVYTPASLADNLANGLKVEAEGPIVGGVLQAREIKIRGNQIKVEATVFDKDDTANTVTFRMNPGQTDGSSDVTVQLNSNTRGENGVSSATDVSIGDFLELRARPDVTDASLLIGTRMERETEADDFALQGPVGAWDATSISLLNVTYTLDASTRYCGHNDEVCSLTQQDFFALLSEGTLIKVKDKNDPSKANENADGIADEVELEN